VCCTGRRRVPQSRRPTCRDGTHLRSGAGFLLHAQRDAVSRRESRMMCPPATTWLTTAWRSARSGHRRTERTQSTDYPGVSHASRMTNMSWSFFRQRGSVTGPARPPQPCPASTKTDNSRSQCRLRRSRTVLDIPGANDLGDMGSMIAFMTQRRNSMRRLSLP
jgi:hypothetical protein